MKKILLLLIVLFMFFVSIGCSDKTDDNTERPKAVKTHEDLNFTELPYESEWISNNLSKLGHKNLSVNKAIEWNFVASDSKPRWVYLLSDYEKSEIYHYSCLAIETESKVLFKDLTDDPYSGSYSDLLYVNDVDYDGVDDIILQQTVGMTGGNGQYLSRIFKLTNNEIQEIFNSSTINLYDTGFTNTFNDKFELEIKNKFTGYAKTVDFMSDEQYSVINENKEFVLNKVIWCDSFNRFIPQDVDSYGFFEIVCFQYVSLYDHANYIGDAKSVLKYNLNKKEFEVINAEFIQVK